jgi:RecA-family ATPase
MAAMDILQAFSEQPVPFDFVLPGMLTGSVGFILSPGGVGKSMFSLEVACAVASGTTEGDLLGLEVKQGKVLYMAAEDPEEAIHHRLFAMGKRFGAETRQRIANNIQVHSVVGKLPDIMDPRWYNAIIAGAQGYRLIILDTLTRFHKLDENSNGEMSQLISQLEYIAVQTGAALLIPHHSSKSMAVAGRGDEQQSSRGASALIDNARWAGNLIGMTKEEALALSDAQGGSAIGVDDRGFYVRFAISKQNHGKPFPETWLVRSEGGVLVRTMLHPVTKRKAARDEV